MLSRKGLQQKKEKESEHRTEGRRKYGQKAKRIKKKQKELIESLRLSYNFLCLYC